MSMNGSGVFVVNSAGQPVVATTLITAVAFNAYTADAATAISTAIMKDGQTTISANIPFNAKKITGLGAASARTDGASLATIQDGTGVYVATVGGTADVITLTAAPAIAAYAAGQTFKFIAAGPNTTNVTVAINGLAAKAITKNGTTALVAGDILSGSMVSMVYDGTRFILEARNLATVLPTLTAHAVYVGNGAAAPTALAVGATNTVLHGNTGADPSYSAVVEADITTADNTTNNVTSSKHGFCPKAPADATTFLNGANPPAYTVPVGTLTAGTTCTQNPYVGTTVTTQAHGLGTTPSVIVAYLECLTAEFGYSIGDRVAYNFSWAGGGSSGWFVEYDSTNLRILSGGGLVGINRTSPAASINLTSANWKVVATPYKLN